MPATLSGYDLPLSDAVFAHSLAYVPAVYELICKQAATVLQGRSFAVGELEYSISVHEPLGRAKKGSASPVRAALNALQICMQLQQQQKRLSFSRCKNRFFPRSCIAGYATKRSADDTE
eukprot:11973-Heterococcus_DN1.PRE.3